MTGTAAADGVAAARRSLGRIGVFLPHSLTTPTPVQAQREAVQRFERAGYRSAWTNEVPGKDALVQLAVLLAATEHLAFGTGILNVWVRPPYTAHGAIAQLAEADPGRVVVGLGVGHAPQAANAGADFDRPLAIMRRYLQRMDAPDPGLLPAPHAAYPRIVGANGPKMLALAAELTDGAMPAMVAPRVTAAARSALGPDKLLVVLIDAGAPQDTAEVSATVRAHHAAGADHVVAGLPMGTDFAAGVDRLEALAPALTGVS